MRICWAKIIPVRWYNAAASLFILAAAASGADDLAGLVRPYRQSPTPPRRAAIEAYAVTHAKEAPLASLALGVTAYEQKDYAAAVAALRRANIPQIADYVAYYLAAAQVELKETEPVARELAATHTGEAKSPFSGKAWLLEARSRGAEGIPLLREHYADLPQPDGDVTLADLYQAAGDLAHAAEFYQRVFYQYISGEAAARSAAALLTIRDAMGANYPMPLPQQALLRADLLLSARQYAVARSEYESLLDQLVGGERDQARVRIGAADLGAGKPGYALPYLRGLEIPESEADAERLYYIEEAARRMNDDASMAAAIEQISRKYPKSSWRLKALAGGASRYLVTNRPDDYLPLYKKLYEDFPTDGQAGLYHWKVTFRAYWKGDRDAEELMREHLVRYPFHATAGAAFYFLGRLAEQNRNPAAARAYYERIVQGLPNQFYTIEARERLRQPEIGAASPAPDAVRFAAEVRLNQPPPVPAVPTRPTTLRIERSRLLRSAGLSDLADAELRFGARVDSQSQLLGMEIAGAAESSYVGLRAMKALGGDYLALSMDQAPRKFWEMLFPMPYKSDIEADARLRGLDPFLMAGLIRQESEFNPQAVSPANACGLMQVRPGTGREVARRAGVLKFSSRMLFQPAVNLKIGSYILRSMIDSNGGKLEETLASYNAGPQRVVEWRTWGSFRERAEFIESIPFTETRDYVQAVLRNAEMYRRLYK